MVTGIGAETRTTTDGRSCSGEWQQVSQGKERPEQDANGAAGSNSALRTAEILV